MQSDNLKNPLYKDPIDCFKQVTSKKYSVLFQGFTPCIMRSAPVNGCSFLVFEKIMDYFGFRNEKIEN